MNTDKAAERHIVCKVYTSAKHREAVQSLLLTLLEPARAEPGCLYYHLYRSSEDDTTFFIVDGWASDDSVAAHLAHPNVISVVEKLTPLLRAPLEISTNIRLSEPPR
jgi:quinol monooxygenase YgiN